MVVCVVLFLFFFHLRFFFFLSIDLNYLQTPCHRTPYKSINKSNQKIKESIYELNRERTKPFPEGMRRWELSGEKRSWLSWEEEDEAVQETERGEDISLTSLTITLLSRSKQLMYLPQGEKRQERRNPDVDIVPTSLRSILLNKSQK